jgi:catechol 2,3-dioxygenase-like lactoylglutathione lyase family enzyme
MGRAQLVGINHIALEVGDIDAALDFYGRLLDFELRGRIGSRMAFLDAGDQFIALSAGRTQPPDEARHFGLVVDDRAGLRRALEEAGVEIIGSGLDFRDPWGNRIQVVQYDEIQFTKTPGVLRAMGLDGLGKTPEAEEELRRKGVGGDD